MPWCGFWGTTGFACWWILPLIGLVSIGLMVFVCFRRFGCMGGRRRTSGDSSGLERDLENPTDEVRKLRHDPMGTRSNAEAQSAPESGIPSDERGRSGKDETPRGCCTPKRL